MLITCKNRRKEEENKEIRKIKKGAPGPLFMSAKYMFRSIPVPVWKAVPATGTTSGEAG